MRAILAVAILILCLPKFQAFSTTTVNEERCIVREGRSIRQIALSNDGGMIVRVSNYAASITDIISPDRYGHCGHVVLGFDSVESYFGRHPKFGAMVGRYANRIANAEFKLDSQTYMLERNSKEHSIHGGSNGFNRQIFDIDTFYATCDTAVVVMHHCSPHLTGGFPGNLNVSVAYKLTNNNEVILEYEATTDVPTVVNLTNHSYFNLSGCRNSVLDHTFCIYADSITSVNQSGIPTGELVPVSNTVYDLTVPRSVRMSVIESGAGYDINYKLNNQSGTLALAAVAVDSVSGRMLKAYTTEPGMQFYLPGSKMDYVGHAGIQYGPYYGFCMEMQHFPDSPNHPNFPSTVVYPGTAYRQTTIYKFDVLH